MWTRWSKCQSRSRFKCPWSHKLRRPLRCLRLSMWTTMCTFLCKSIVTCLCTFLCRRLWRSTSSRQSRRLSTCQLSSKSKCRRSRPSRRLWKFRLCRLLRRWLRSLSSERPCREPRQRPRSNWIHNARSTLHRLFSSSTQVRTIQLNSRPCTSWVVWLSLVRKSSCNRKALRLFRRWNNFQWPELCTSASNGSFFLLFVACFLLLHVGPCPAVLYPLAGSDELLT